jgi:uncharacterized membrane protein
MENGLVWLIVATAAFVGSHFLLSHPLRAGLVRALGPHLFQALYSVVAFATLGWTVHVFRQLPSGPVIWDGHSTLAWVLASVLTFVASALFFASLIGNPAFPGMPLDGLANAEPKGVYRITRHPMMFSFVIWALAHVIVAPAPRNFVLMAGIALLALAGAAMQDIKKEKLHGRDWKAWRQKTNFWPDPVQLPHLGIFWGVALLPWLLFTWLHMPLAQEPAGLWMMLQG